MCLREKIGPDPRNFNQRVSLGRNNLLIRTFLANTFLPFGSRFLIAFNSVKLAPGYTDSCSLILPG